MIIIEKINNGVFNKELVNFTPNQLFILKELVKLSYKDGLNNGLEECGEIFKEQIKKHYEKSNNN